MVCDITDPFVVECVSHVSKGMIQHIDVQQGQKSRHEDWRSSGLLRKSLSQTIPYFI